MPEKEQQETENQELPEDAPTEQASGMSGTPAIDREALAEKVLALLRRELELETERFGKFFNR